MTSTQLADCYIKTMESESEANSPDNAQDSAMYLRQMTIKNFKSCRDTTILFQENLTILVGENNAGKSNIIDALRLSTVPLNRRRSRYFEIDDVNYADPVAPVIIENEYAQLSEFQAAHYIAAYDILTETATYRTQYLPNTDNPRLSRVEHAAGKVGKADTESEKREQINHVYLAPLRDANRELDSGTGNRLPLIMQSLLSSEVRDDFLAQAKDKFDKLEEHPAITETRDKLQTQLTGLTDAVRSQKVGIAFDDLRLDRLARSLRMKMAEHELDLSDLMSSGLGYANLLFLASVVLELNNVSESELTLFLVEEPEAHLHPQLQAVLLDYLQDQAKKSASGDMFGPAGRIQVVATTHSPNLASVAGIDNVVVIKSVDDPDKSSSRRQTQALPLSKLELPDRDKRKINQYLDVTRAELLFARTVILVEGIAELVIIPALVRYSLYGDESDASKILLRRFKGVSLVSVGSVDFKPYIQLLLQEIDGSRLVDRLVVVTDKDPALPVDTELIEESDTLPGSDDNEEEEEETDEDVVYNRASDLREFARSLGVETNLHIAEAPHTLEADLIEPIDKNETAYKAAFEAQKTRSKKTWRAIVADSDPAMAMYTKLRKNKKFISKGQFAHDFALELSKKKGYQCPAYIETAIKFAMGESIEP